MYQNFINNILKMEANIPFYFEVHVESLAFCLAMHKKQTWENSGVRENYTTSGFFFFLSFFFFPFLPLSFVVLFAFWVDFVLAEKVSTKMSSNIIIFN